MSADKRDQEIQDMLDKRIQHEPFDEEAKTYLSLYEALKNPPVEKYLSDSFADTVVSQISLKPQKKDLEAFWWFGSMIVFMMLVSTAILVSVMSVMKMEALNMIVKYMPMVGLLTAVIVGVQWMDKKLIKMQI